MDYKRARLVSIFKNEINYWIIENRTKQLYGPFTKVEYQAMRKKLMIPKGLEVKIWLECWDRMLLVSANPTSFKLSNVGDACFTNNTNPFWHFFRRARAIKRVFLSKCQHFAPVASLLLYLSSVQQLKLVNQPVRQIDVAQHISMSSRTVKTHWNSVKQCLS